MKKRVIGVVGMGHVGAHVAFVLGMRGAADVVKICDINEQKAIRTSGFDGCRPFHAASCRLCDCKV